MNLKLSENSAFLNLSTICISKPVLEETEAQEGSKSFVIQDLSCPYRL